MSLIDRDYFDCRRVLRDDPAPTPPALPRILLDLAASRDAGEMLRRLLAIR